MSDTVRHPRHYNAGTIEVIAELREARGERAAVVAWLRAQGMAPYAQSNLDHAATMIERGEHRREEKP